MTDDPELMTPYERQQHGINSGPIVRRITARLDPEAQAVLDRYRVDIWEFVPSAIDSRCDDLIAREVKIMADKLLSALRGALGRVPDRSRIGLVRDVARLVVWVAFRSLTDWRLRDLPEEVRTSIQQARSRCVEPYSEHRAFTEGEAAVVSHGVSGLAKLLRERGGEAMAAALDFAGWQTDAFACRDLGVTSNREPAP